MKKVTHKSTVSGAAEQIPGASDSDIIEACHQLGIDLASRPNKTLTREEIERIRKYLESKKGKRQ